MLLSSASCGRRSIAGETMPRTSASPPTTTPFIRTWHHSINHVPVGPVSRYMGRGMLSMCHPLPVPILTRCVAVIPHHAVNLPVKNIPSALPMCAVTHVGRDVCCPGTQQVLSSSRNKRFHYHSKSVGMVMDMPPLHCAFLPRGSALKKDERFE